MIVSDRVRERMEVRGLSQSELARRVGVSQPTIYKLLHTAKKGSTKLHLIARELGTSPAYLAGETDDPDLNAPPPPAPVPPVIMMAVSLPPERALVRMFQALLAGIDPDASRDEQALLLAQRLPIGLSQLRDLLPDSVTATWRSEPADADATRAMLHPEPIR